MREFFICYDTGVRYIDEGKWRAAFSREDWYRIIYPEFVVLEQRWKDAPADEKRRIADDVYGFVEDALANGEIPLGRFGKNWDAERRAIDTIVVHHTNIPPGITWQRLDAMHLLRLYAKSYCSPTTEREIAGQPVYSHHFRSDGRQVFYAYHWLVRMDGAVERLLADHEIGWQAGNWDINCRSIAICFDNDLSDSSPPREAIEAAARIIRVYYPQVVAERVIGHYVANPLTTCPGARFANGWRNELLRFSLRDH